MKPHATTPNIKSDRPGLTGVRRFFALGRSMKLLFWAVSAFGMALVGISSANAVGGAGCYFGNTAIGLAVATGTSADFERAVAQRMDEDEQQNYKNSGFLSLDEKASRTEWRQKRTKLLLEGNHPVGCTPSLLPEAIGKGNIDVVSFLINRPFGIDLRVNINTINVCHSWPYRLRLNDEERAKRRKALAFVLDAIDIDLNSPATNGLTVLQTCPEIELLDLFVERGARVDTESDKWSINASSGMRMTLLELAIADALFFVDSSYTAQNLNGLERARFFSKMLPNSIQGRPVEPYVRRACDLSSSGQWHQETCRALRMFIKATPGTFGEQ